MKGNRTRGRCRRKPWGWLPKPRTPFYGCRPCRLEFRSKKKLDEHQRDFHGVVVRESV